MDVEDGERREGAEVTQEGPQTRDRQPDDDQTTRDAGGEAGSVVASGAEVEAVDGAKPGAPGQGDSVASVPEPSSSNSSSSSSSSSAGPKSSEAEPAADPVKRTEFHDAREAAAAVEARRKQLDIRGTKRPRKEANICPVAGCNGWKELGGFCTTHGGGRRCEVEGCKKRAQGQGKCIAHGAPTKICEQAGCKSKANLFGFCQRHGGFSICREPGCETRASAGGYCLTHGGGRCHMRAPRRCQKKCVRYHLFCADHIHLEASMPRPPPPTAMPDSVAKHDGLVRDEAVADDAVYAKGADDPALAAHDQQSGHIDDGVPSSLAAESSAAPNGSADGPAEEHQLIDHDQGPHTAQQNGSDDQDALDAELPAAHF